MKIMVTGTAGFIGNHLALRLLERGDEVIGIDNLNDYYDVNLKLSRLVRIKDHPGFTDVRLDIADRTGMEAVFKKYQPQKVVNLAAQAGVRYSIQNPHAYIDSNLVGFINILEGCRHNKVEHLVYASSSSVYGANESMPFSVHDNVDHPLSLYAASKKANELMAYTYSHLFGIQTIGLRFFTVYGPWGRPDMAMFLFTDAIFNEKPIKVFNQGELYRDFTYIDDIVNGVVATLTQNNEKNYEIYNIGNGNPVKLTDFIDAIEVETNLKFTKEMYPMQPGDVERTWADTSEFEKEYNYKPSVSVPSGIKEFVSWYKMYYSTHK